MGKCITVYLYVFLFLFVALSCTFAQSQGPQLTSLFPAGGQRGNSIEVTLNGTFPTWPVKIWCDQSDCACTASEVSGKIDVKISSDAPPGVRWLRFYDSNGASDVRPFIVGLIAETSETKETKETKTEPVPFKAQSVDSLPITINGVLDKGSNVDSYSLKLLKGEVLIASVDANRGPGSPLDATLQILDNAGHVLEQNLDCHDLDPQIVFRAPSDGEYHVRIFGFPDKPDSTIAYAAGPALIYRLTLTTGPYVEATLPLALSSKDATALRAIGFNTSSLSTLTMTPQGDGSKPAAVVFPSSLGTLHLPIISYPNLLEQEQQDSSVKQSIPIPCCITGRIQSRKEKDVFRIQAIAKSRWKIRLQSRSLGYPMDGELTLLDAQGKQLVKQDDTDKQADPTISWQAPEDGTYSLVVSDLYGQSSDQHIYRLTIEEDRPTVKLTCPNAIIKGTVGQPVEVTVSIQRLLDFADELAISLEDIPPTVSVGEVPSSVGNDSAKSVKLLLQATGPFQGPIRIVAQSKVTPSQKLYAEVVDNHHQTLWLSITQPTK